jgi:hypothetical protein
MDIEKSYKELAKKYKLPEFSMLDREFEISTIENDTFLLREIISKIADKIEFYTILLNNILHPDNGQLGLMHECRFFDDERKKSVLELYGVFMKFDRRSVLVSLSGKEDENAKFISDFAREWPTLKEKLKEIVTVMHNAWSEDLAMNERLGYFG